MTLCSGKAQKGPEKILCLHLRLILSTETAYNNKKQIKSNNQKANIGEGEESDFQKGHITRFKLPVFNNNNKSQFI